MPGNTNWRPQHNPWMIAVAVMLATFMEVMDTSISSVAIPYIAGSVSATNDEATWVLTTYLVANAIFLPSSAWFSEKFGRKNFLIVSVLVFTAASFACGIANSLGLLLLARAIQGAGGGALQPLSQAILMESFPPEKQSQALGMYAMGVVVAPIIGPTFGGWLTDTISWRWAYYINVPIGLTAAFLQSRVLEDPPYIKSAKPGRLDGIGFGLLAIWTACLQFICDKGQEEDWFGSSKIKLAFVLFSVALAAFLLREFLHRKPLVNLRLLGNRNLFLGSFLIFMFGAGVYSLTAILPLFYQTLMGYDATTAGLVVSPRGIGAFCSAVLVGYMASKMDSRKIIAAGFLVFGLMGYWTSDLTLSISPWSLFWPITIAGFALPAVFIPLSSSALGTLRQDQINSASGIFNLLRNMGGSIGIAAANTILMRHRQVHRDELVHSLSGASLALRHTLDRLVLLMHLHAGPQLATRRAYGVIQNSLDRQAQLWSYVDDFRYLALVSIVCVPIAFFLQRTVVRRHAG
ncbi:MAG TPA: DHA2 family efflux MFS transporter permease subunit [Bryobacteraceae bacterium]|nr:DHA2 family efflux MFS transporter permease subunit [Bryobacteraceae bacterium]